MAGSIPAARKALIASFVAQTRRHPAAGLPVKLADFIPRYFRGVDEDDLRASSPRAMVAAAAAHLAFGATRRAGEPSVRVYNPSVDESAELAQHTVIEIVTEDMPFLVDSMATVLNQSGLSMHLMVHPVLQAYRDRRGRLVALGPDATVRDGTPIMESWERIAVDREGDPARLEALRARILAVLADVRVAVEDWPKIRQHATMIARDVQVDVPGISRAEEAEAAAFLEWLADNHFTLLGYREYKLVAVGGADRLVPVVGTGLGLLRDGHGGRKAETKLLQGEISRRAREATVLVVTKANSVSTVHRPSYLDYVGVKTFDPAGKVIGERRFVGLFTSTAYSASPREIPLLRHKIQRVIDLIGVQPVSHDGKALLHVLETYPRDELFQSSVAELVRTCRAIVNLYERKRVRLFVRRDPYHRFFSCLLYVPRDRYNTDVRSRIERILLEQLHGEALESQVQISESALARLHTLVRTAPESQSDPDVERIERLIAEAVRSWADRLHDGLRARHDEHRAATLSRRYGNAFPTAYQEDIEIDAAVGDIDRLEQLPETAGAIGLVLQSGDREKVTVNLRLYSRREPVAMSDILPMLENFDLRILNERPYRVSVDATTVLWIQDLEVAHASGQALDPSKIATRFEQAFFAVWSGHAESDGFNRLVLGAELDWRDALLLRAVGRYLLQTGWPFSQGYMESVLARHPAFALMLVKLFTARFDPALPATRRRAHTDAAERALAEALEHVTSPDDDRMLRAFRSVIQAALRTNHYQHAADGQPKDYLSIKLDPQRIGELPKPRPMFEIWVYSPRVEGVHLRMARVARGGLRWSDRREDFRTEVLGLMKAQNVKNTVIVPDGAKGGFVPKLPPGETREEIQREGVECYRIFIRALLDITDNVSGSKLIPPPQVVRHDGDDAYLVVAADKGTATFSDIANALAAEYGFWLGDAFASGGSAGYDHKKMGITAKGGWECVKRHFRELGHDTQTQPFTVAGVGDMAGDVFGNGMLLSNQIRLVAAFNHQHIFIDPDPESARSLRERARLFALPRSAWTDYDPKALSKGGGVHARNAKELSLSPQARELLGLDSVKATPTEVVRAILRLPVDLLWNGGIGTYAKASWEANSAVGDRANDAVRLDGRELRCRVIGEGGNLGFTQLGRVEYALHGGRCNTDFVDNSAGVDCSDHEVNIKILLDVVDRRGKLTTPARNRLLADMTDEVGALVLRDNYLQSQALSLLESVAAERLGEHAHLIRSLEVAGQLDRAIEYLPNAEEIEDRRAAGKGLTRPELAMLLAYAKIALNAQLLAADVAEDPYLRRELDRYFPVRLVKRYAELLPQHRLQREIICTATTNSVVNRMGPTFVARAQQDTGADAATVTRAYTIAREAFDARTLWSRIERLDNSVAAPVQYGMMLDSVALLRQASYWLVQRQRDSLGIDTQVGRLRPGVQELLRTLPQWLSGGDATIYRQRLESLTAAGVPADLARQIAGLPALQSAPDIVDLAQLSKLGVENAARAYVGAGALVGLDWLRQRIEALDTHGHWHAVARGTLRETVFDVHRRLTQRILSGTRERDPARAVAQWAAKHAPALEHSRNVIEDIRAQTTIDFASLSVALQALRRLAGNDG